MSNENALAIVPKDFAEVQSFSEVLAKSALLPEALRGKPADVVVQILAGRELGIPPMAAIRGVHVVLGKPILSADAMIAVALGSGKCVYFRRVAESDKSVTWETLRVGWTTPQQCTWTMDMAKSAALNTKDNWRAYPRSMLSARAAAELARSAYPDVLLGCYVDDEIPAAAGVVPAPATPPPRTPDDISDAEIVLDGAMDPAEKALADIDAATSLEQLQAMSKDIVALKLTGAAKVQVNEKYKARCKLFKELAATADAMLREQDAKNKAEVAPASEVAA